MKLELVQERDENARLREEVCQITADYCFIVISHFFHQIKRLQDFEGDAKKYKTKLVSLEKKYEVLEISFHEKRKELLELYDKHSALEKRLKLARQSFESELEGTKVAYEAKIASYEEEVSIRKVRLQQQKDITEELKKNNVWKGVSFA